MILNMRRDQRRNGKKMKDIRIWIDMEGTNFIGKAGDCKVTVYVTRILSGGNNVWAQNVIAQDQERSFSCVTGCGWCCCS